MRLSLAMLLVVIFAAACGGSEDNRVIPTEMVLVTLPPTEENTQPDPALIDAEPTTTTSDTDSTKANNAQSAPETDDTADQSVSLPFVNTDENVSNVPSFMQGVGGNGEWLVSGEEAINAYLCPEITCDIVAKFEPGEALNVVEQAEAWLTVLIGPVQAYVELSSAEQQQPQVNLPFGAPGSAPSDSSGQALPPFANAGGPPVFPGATGGEETTPMPSDSGN